jgi:hypothetical protein
LRDWFNAAPLAAMTVFRHQAAQARPRPNPGKSISLDFRDWVRGPTGRPLVNSTSSPLSFLAAKSLVKFFYTKIFIEGMSTR